jgi:serine protease Do
MRGEVVGITSAKISSVGVEGLGYAISINKAMPIIEELMASLP